jgi:hypothetical protein
MLRSGVAVRLTQFPDFAESETGEAPVHVFNPGATKDLHSTGASSRGQQPFCPRPGFQKRLGQGRQMPSDRNFISRAKRRRILRRIARRKGSKSSFFAPPYSFEITSFPGFTIPLLTDRLKVRFLPRPPSNQALSGIGLSTKIERGRFGAGARYTVHFASALDNRSSNRIVLLRAAGCEIHRHTSGAQTAASPWRFLQPLANLLTVNCDRDRNSYRNKLH